MITLINGYRQERSRPWIDEDATQSLWCFAHCIEMAKSETVLRADEKYLNGWEEIVDSVDEGFCSTSSEKRLFFQMTENENNSNLILWANQIGCGVIHYKRKVYGTIRVRRN